MSIVRFDIVRNSAVVAEGVRFSSGKTAITWLGDVESVTVYGSLFDAHKIHGHKGTKFIFYTDDGSDAQAAITCYQLDIIECYGQPNALIVDESRGLPYPSGKSPEWIDVYRTFFAQVALDLFDGGDWKTLTHKNGLCMTAPHKYTWTDYWYRPDVELE